MLSCWIILLYLWKVRKELGESFFVTVLAVQSGLEFRSQHPLARPDVMPLTPVSKHPMPSIDMLIHREMGTSPKQTHK